MGTDIGTYHVKVYLKNGSAFIQKWETGPRYMHGRGTIHPIDAMRIPPIAEDEAQIFDAMVYQYTEGNYSCDCNLGDFEAQAAQRDEPEMPCGNTLAPVKLVAVRPDGSELTIYDASELN